MLKTAKSLKNHTKSRKGSQNFIIDPRIVKLVIQTKQLQESVPVIPRIHQTGIVNEAITLIPLEIPIKLSSRIS